MGTRGLYGVRKNGIDRATYNHFDSYPEWLGKEIITFCANNDVESLNEFFNLIKLVNENDIPTKEQAEYCTSLGLADMSVSTQNLYDWYCLVRNLQGNFKMYQKLIDNRNKIYMTDGIDFIKDSLFCEYAYIINLDDNVLEFYKGFQHKPQEGNRYGTAAYDYDCRVSEYYPCKLLMAFPLDGITSESAERILNEMIKAVEAEYDEEED